MHMLIILFDLINFDRILNIKKIYTIETDFYKSRMLHSMIYVDIVWPEREVRLPQWITQSQATYALRAVGECRISSKIEIAFLHKPHIIYFVVTLINIITHHYYHDNNRKGEIYQWTFDIIDNVSSKLNVVQYITLHLCSFQE